MSADDGQPRRKRTRMQASRKTRSSSQSPACSSKRGSKRNLAPRPEAKANKDDPSTSAGKGSSPKTALVFGRQSPVKTFPSPERETFPSPERGEESVQPVSLRHQNHNVVHYLTSAILTRSHDMKSSQFLHGPLIRSWSNLVPYSPVYGSTVQSPFKRRVTVLVCHPEYPNLVVAGSKGGELMLYNLSNLSKEKFIDGIGAGGSVVALKFHPERPSSVYTACVGGKVRIQDFCGMYDSILMDTCIWSNWFCSLDVLPEKKIMMAGDSLGWLCVASDNGEKVHHKIRMHKSKVTHAEFCPKVPHLFVTSSTDHTVKLWDLRMLSSDQRAYPLHTLVHNKGINSAYFSPSSSSLLTTDQHNELRVYSSPWWDLEVTILHPHRHFQHLTPIKASWHPMFDAIIVGRYPDKNFCEVDSPTIDFYDGHTGKELYRLQSEDISGITSLNYYNCSGEVLASGYGYHVVFWHNKEETGKLSSSGDDQSPDQRKPPRSRRNKRPKYKSKKLSLMPRMHIPQH